VAEARGGLDVVHRGRLALEARQLPQQVVDEHVRHVVRSPTDDDAKGGEVGAVVRERVRGDLPAALAQQFDTSKTV
jgi:hypothetical protein